MGVIIVFIRKNINNILLKSIFHATLLFWLGVRQLAKFQKRLRNHFSGDQMLMKDTIAHSVEWSMPINFQGGDN